MKQITELVDADDMIFQLDCKRYLMNIYNALYDDLEENEGKSM